jgi:hypothetical protein
MTVRGSKNGATLIPALGRQVFAAFHRKKAGLVGNPLQ